MQTCIELGDIWLRVDHIGDIHGGMVTIIGNKHRDPSKILDVVVCTSHSTNTFGKGMNPTIILPAIGKS